MNLHNRTYISGLCSTFPQNKYTQQQMKEAFLRNNPPRDDKDRDFVDRVFTGSKIEECYSSLSEQDLFRRMTREEYISHVKGTLKDMGIMASIGALSEWSRNSGQNLDCSLGSITHIIWGSMTGGMHAPTMDIELIYALGLPRTVKRLNVENMGCLTGFRCLGLASSIAKEDLNNKVLLVVGDVRNSLGNLFTEHRNGDQLDKSNVITASLFRDSCAAAVVTQDPTRAIYEILHHESFLIPDSFEYVKYREVDPNRVHLYISRDLPSLVASHVPDFVKKITSTVEVDIHEMDICCHTGGPRVLYGVRDALGTIDDRMKSSWHVMRKYGNLSGSSNLVVLDFNRKKDINPDQKEHVLCLSMGPGIGIEGLLLKSL